MAYLAHVGGGLANCDIAHAIQLTIINFRVSIFLCLRMSVALTMDFITPESELICSIWFTKALELVETCLKFAPLVSWPSCPVSFFLTLCKFLGITCKTISSTQINILGSVWKIQWKREVASGRRNSSLNSENWSL